MALEHRSLPKAVGIQILGIDPLNLSNEEAAELRQAFNTHSVLLLRGIHLSPRAHVELTHVLGEPDIHPIATGRLEGYPEILVPKPYGLTHSDDPDEIIGRIPWHSDLTYTTTPPRGALLRGVEIPAEGGRTGFIDSAAVYQALGNDMQQRIEQLEAVHRMTRGQRMLGFELDDEKAAQVASQFPDVIQPLVLRDPETREPALNISPLFADEVLGMDPTAGDALLQELTEFATRETFVYWHDWQEDDLVIWNNYRTLHCAEGHPQKFARTMHRTTLKAEQALGRLLEETGAKMNQEAVQ